MTALGSEREKIFSGRRNLRLASAAIAVLSVASAALVAPVAASSSTTWNDATLHVVGGPVLAGNMLLVLNVTAQKELEVSGVNPTNGNVAWNHPYSPSQITLGAAFTPIAIGSTALVLAPATTPSNPVVQVEGVNVDSGKILWKIKQPLDVTDAPVVCDEGELFCFPAFSSETATDLVAVEPSTGVIAGLVPGPLRNVGVAIPGATNLTTLWQTDGETETIMETSTNGRKVWSHTVASLFGGHQYSINYGYDFLVTNNLDIGAVGVTPVDKKESVSEIKTIGVVPSSGDVKWRAPGSIFCMGSLQFLTPLLTCNLTGTFNFASSSLNMSGDTLTLTGISASTGTSTWSEPVANVKALTIGTNVAFSDESHLVIETLAKKWELLDVQNGRLSPISSGETFWCEQTPSFKVIAIQGVADSGSRASEPVFTGCSKTGTPVSTLPSTTPSTVGVEVGNRFIWSSPKGLRSSAG